MKKIIIADPISPKGVELLKNCEGFEVIEAYNSPVEKVKELVRDASAFIVRSETTLSADVLAESKQLIAIGRAGVGVDNIDVPAATEKGIVVMNTPTGNTIATAELTFTHMLCGARPIPQANAAMQSGGWDRKNFKGTELFNKTLAILGMGRIGTEIAKRAKAFNMTVLAYDPYLTEAKAKSVGVEIVTLDEAFAAADFITVHMPLTSATKHMINADSIAKMKKGVRIFNCARGEIVNVPDLIEGLNSGKIAAAGLDVYENEPLEKDSPLRGIKNLVLTPHLGASTSEAQESCGIEVAELIANALTTGEIKNSVNTPSADADTIKKFAPHMELCEKLGSLIQQVSPNRIAKLKIEFFGKLAETDNTLLILAVQKGYLKKISDSANDVNSPSILKNLGVEVQVARSSAETNYAELISVTSECEDGETHSASGTIVGKNSQQRIVSINEKVVEVAPKNCLLFLRNTDTSGVVGIIGTVLGKHGCNIANLTVSRVDGEKTALSVYELDEVPSAKVIADVEALDCVSRLKVVDFTK